MKLDFWSFLIGLLFAVVGNVVTHRLTLNRERMSRKFEVAGFLGRWIGKTKHGDVRAVYIEFLDSLWGYYGRDMGDYCRRAEFRRLCHDLGSLNPEDIQKDQERYREAIITKAEALLDFINAYNTSIGYKICHLLTVRRQRTP
ncbi:MAG: hypothetical protein ABSC89_05975 [Verrucomicrobiota bacterium]|jgi:hypothetical protein